MSLRRMVLDLDLDAISPLGELLARFYRNNSSMELLQTLFTSDDVVVELVRVRRDSDFYTLEEIAGKRNGLLRKYGLMDFEILEADPGAGSYTAIIKHRTPPKIAPVLRELGGSVYLASPLGIRKGNVTLTLFIDGRKAPALTRLLSRQGIGHTVRSVSDAFGGSGKGSGLTASQLSLLRLANAMGYFDVPRKVTTDDVARIAGITAPAVSKAIRKAEKVLVERLLKESISL